MTDSNNKPESRKPGSHQASWVEKYIVRFDTPAPMVKWLWLAAIVVLLDQLTKAWVDSQFYLGEKIEVMPFFNLTLAYNHGAAFSFLSDAGGWQRWFFIGLAMIVSIVLVRWIKALPAGANATAISFSLILGGAIGNLIDRVVTGYVIDFIDWYVPAWGHWPAFNIADSALSVGASLMIYLAIFRPAEIATNGAEEKND